jgi:hypothetical protein
MVNNMYPARVAALLFELIAEVGLDIDQPGRQWLELNPPLDVDKFTDAVLAVEFKDQPVRPSLRAQVRSRVFKHFTDAHQESAG